MSKRKTGAGTLIRFRNSDHFTFATGPFEGGGFTYEGGASGSYYVQKATYEDAITYIRQLLSKINQLGLEQEKLRTGILQLLGVEEENNG
jgi:hypothetical protein